MNSYPDFSPQGYQVISELGRPVWFGCNADLSTDWDKINADAQFN